MIISPQTTAVFGLAVAVISLLLIVVLALRAFRPSTVPFDATRATAAAEEAGARVERAVREELSIARGEAAGAATLLREEVGTAFKSLGETLRGTMSDLTSSQKGQLDALAMTLGQAKQEGAAAAHALREEVTNVLTRLGTALNEAIANQSQAQNQRLEDVTKQIGVLTDGNETRQQALKSEIESRLSEIRTETATSAVQLREEVAKTLKSVGDTLKETLTQMSEAQRERLTQVTTSLGQMTDQQKQQQDALKAAVEGRLDVLRQENADKLEQMRVTVDEKLQGTLEQRLGASFQLVSERLEQVYKSVGEMQTLAAGVGDLKRVLTNVRARGAWGEVVLGSLLEQVLAPEQFDRNVEVVPGSNRRVEFAIKLPGHGDGEGPLWLPVDSKFPNEAYDRLARAAEHGDNEAVEAAGWELETAVRGAAKDISEKYVAPPHSTDFGVLFLPTEGLYAEVLRRPGLVDALQRDYRVAVTGPTTLAALLNSLRLGFRTLAIQKRSSEVWQLLGAVKTEFGKYGEVMDRVKKRLEQATTELENVAVRRRALDRKLRGVETIPEIEAASLLTLPNAAGDVTAEDAA